MSILARTTEGLAKAAGIIAGAARSGWESKARASSGEARMASMLSAGGTYAYPTSWSGSKYEHVRHYRLWNYIGVRAIAEEIARRPPDVGKIIRGTPKQKFIRKSQATKQQHEEIEPVDSDHPLYRLVHNPNRPDTAYTFWFRTMLFLELSGECYWWKIRNAAGIPVELWPIFPHWVTPRLGKTRIVDRYEIRPVGAGSAGVQSIFLDADDVVPILYPGPLSLTAGWSPTMAGAEWIDTGEAIDASRWYEYENGSFPGTVISTDPKFYGTGAPPAPDINRMKLDYKANHQGKEKAGSLLVLPPGMKADQIQRSPSEMSYTESGDIMRDWILAIRRVSKSVAGLVEGTNRASMEASLADFLRGTIGTKLIMISQIATEQLAHEFDEDLTIYWPDLTPENREEKLKEYTAGFACGAVTPNQFAEFLGLPCFEHGGDNPFMNGHELPYGTGTTLADDVLGLPAGGHAAGMADEPDADDDHGNRVKALLNGTNGVH